MTRNALLLNDAARRAAKRINVRDDRGRGTRRAETGPVITARRVSLTDATRSPESGAAFSRITRKSVPVNGTALSLALCPGGRKRWRRLAIGLDHFPSPVRYTQTPR